MSQQLARYGALLRASPDKVIFVDSEDIYRDPWSGNPVNLTSTLKCDVDNDAVKQSVLEARCTSVMVAVEFSSITGDLWFEARCVGSKDREVVVLIRDITTERRFLESLEQQIQARTVEIEATGQELEQFAYAASHDLREPLHKIIAFGNKLQSTCNIGLNEKGKKYVESMVRAADRMSDLIEDLLLYSRAGRVDITKKVYVSVENVVMDVMDLLSESARLSEAQVEIFGEDTLLYGEPTQLRTVVQNLVANAIKFRKPDVPPEITISGSVEGKYSVLTVSDNGIGFDMRFAPKIFQMFERLHPKTEYPGTGIGLALCQKIVLRHGGQLTVESVVNKGTTFTLRLPLPAIVPTSYLKPSPIDSQGRVK